jgi:hypothetical protein
MNREQERRIADLTEAVVTEMRNIMSDDQEQALEQPMEMEVSRSELREGTIAMARNVLVESRGELREEPAIRGMNDNLAPYRININQVHNGFMVEVGCQTFVFESFDKLSKYLKMYFEDPNGTETKFHKNELF